MSGRDVHNLINGKSCQWGLEVPTIGHTPHMDEKLGARDHLLFVDVLLSRPLFIAHCWVDHASSWNSRLETLHRLSVS